MTFITGLFTGFPAGLIVGFIVGAVLTVLACAGAAWQAMDPHA